MINLIRLSPFVLIGIMIVVIILGIRSNLRYAKRLRDAQARGALADMNTPEVKSRFRRLTVLGLFGGLGFFSSIAVIAIQQAQGLTPARIWLPASMVFIIIAIVGGYLMKREFDRRL